MDDDDIQDGLWEFVKFPEDFSIVKRCHRDEEAKLIAKACRKKWDNGFDVPYDEFGL